jgi:ATP-binding cassette, subfamily B, bacterial
MQHEQEKKKFGDMPRKPLEFAWYMTKGYWKWGLPAFIAVTCATMLGAIGPYLFAKIIDSAHVGNADEVYLWVVVFIVSTGLAFAAWRVAGFMGMRFQLNVERTAHLKLFSYLLKHSQTYFNNRFAGSLSSKVSNGADGAEHLLESTLWGYYGIFLNLVITTIYISFVSISMGIFFIGAVFFIVVMIIFWLKKCYHL